MSKEKQKERIYKRNLIIQDEYWKMKDKKDEGVQIYSNEYIIAKLANKFFLAPITVEKILFTKSVYLPKTQLELQFQQQ